MDIRALAFRMYGGPAVMALRRVPQPRPARREVLVRVHAAGLNPVDFKTGEGKLRMVQRYPLPAMMGNELAGVVEGRGEGITRFAHEPRNDGWYSKLCKAMR